MKIVGLAGLVWHCVVLAGAVGWVMNVIAIFHLASADLPVRTMFILRCIGVPLAPLGAVLGWL